ncbi:MAG: hypothetical protein M1819_002961 [Sarea resinae]|nr:MAG: hypothetical protein M1819_002961 [Sarea resinae]
MSSPSRFAGAITLRVTDIAVLAIGFKTRPTVTSPVKAAWAAEFSVSASVENSAIPNFDNKINIRIDIKMSSPYICRSCRSALRSSQQRLASQRIPKARLASFSNSHIKEEESSAVSLKEIERLRRSRLVQGALSLGASHGQRRRHLGADDRLENLFAESATQISQKPVRSKPTANDLEKVTENVLDASARLGKSPLVKLEQSLVSPNASLSESWHIFDEHLSIKSSPFWVRPSAQDRVKLARGAIFKKLLRATVDAWCKGEQTSQIPSPSEAAQKLDRLGLMNLTRWSAAIWDMIVQLSEKSKALKEDATTIRRLQNDLLQLWKEFFVSFNKSARRGRSSENPSSSWPTLLESDSTPVSETVSINDFRERFARLIPIDVLSATVRNVALASYVTFDLLEQHSKATPDNDQGTFEMAGYTELMTPLIAYSSIPNILLHSERFLLSMGFSTTDIEEMFNRAKAIARRPERLLRLSGEKGGLSENQALKLLAEYDHRIEASIARRLNRALERKDLRCVNDLWAEMQKWYELPKDDELEQSQLSPSKEQTTPRAHPQGLPTIPMKLYNHFLTGFMALRQPDRAITVWNTMIRTNQEPDVLSWHAMIDGCRTSRDTKSLEEVWARMLASGIQPDIQCWTTRISGLSRSKHWEQGLRALDEMGKTWLIAAKKAHQNKKGQPFDPKLIGDIPGVAVKPTIEAINAALYPLISQNSRSYTPHSLLSWARLYGITPNIITFNALLRRPVREGHADAAKAILTQMEHARIAPDVATFTILLDGLFRNSELTSLSPSEQKKTIRALLQNMERSGVSANAFSYATLIDGLLKQYANLDAALAVLEHMNVRGLKTTPHIYTSLLTFYFDASPPDLGAVAALWERIRREDGVVDHIFYDRIIEGYAAAGEVGKMISFLRRMPDEGKTPGWDALVAVVRCLVRRKEWGLLREVVGDVEGEAGRFRDGIRGFRGEGEWRRIVEELREDGILT